MFLIYFRHLAWEFSAETVTILAVQVRVDACTRTYTVDGFAFLKASDLGEFVIHFTGMFSTAISLQEEFENRNIGPNFCIYTKYAFLSRRTTKITTVLLFWELPLGHPVRHLGLFFFSPGA